MDELEKLQTQIRELQAKAETILAKRRADAIADIKGKIKAFGLTARELGLHLPHDKANINPPKYEWRGQTWSGRGRQPRFVAEYLDHGGKLDDLLIQE